MTSGTQTLTEEMEKLLDLIWTEFLNTSLNLSGNLKDIECGTHIKIPIAAGYVSAYKSCEDSSLNVKPKLNVTVYLKDDFYIETDLN